MKASSLVRQARRKAGLSQRALAAAARVPQSTVGRIEADRIDPRASTLNKLLEACRHELEAEPRLGDGVDRTQIQRLLDLSPRERVESAAAAAANLGRMVRKSRKRK